MGKSIFALIRIFYETKEVDILVTLGVGDISKPVFTICCCAARRGEVSQSLYPGGIFHGTRRGGSRFIVTRAE